MQSNYGVLLLFVGLFLQVRLPTTTHIIDNEYIKKYNACMSAVVAIHNFDLRLQVLRTSLDSMARLKDSLYRLEVNVYADSLNVAKSMLKYIKRDFGISYKVERKGNYYLFSRTPSRADSAILLLPYYKKALSFDSLKEVWNIERPKTFEEKAARTRKKKKK